MRRSLLSGRENAAILVIDTLELRRAGVVSFLRPWTEANEMRIVETSPQCTSLELEPGSFYKIIVMVIGAAGVGDPMVQDWIASLADRYVDVPLVLVSDREDSIEVITALELGVRGFIPTTTTPAVAIQAFSFIMSGGSFFPPAALTEAAKAARPPHMPEPRKEATVIASVHKGGLTARQQQVLERLTQGASNKLIGRQLKLRESTVKVHVRHIMKKLGATNRTQAALCAAKFAVSKNGSDAAITSNLTTPRSDNRA
jgi:DNA-binding NarL/FixJ family response regulator